MLCLLQAMCVSIPTQWLQRLTSHLLLSVGLHTTQPVFDVLTHRHHEYRLVLPSTLRLSAGYGAAAASSWKLRVQVVYPCFSISRVTGRSVRRRGSSTRWLRTASTSSSYPRLRWDRVSTPRRWHQVRRRETPRIHSMGRQKNFRRHRSLEALEVPTVGRKTVRTQSSCFEICN